ncbi:MAG: glycosyltransferase family 9 protein, partial [Rhizomicrobium sp.]
AWSGKSEHNNDINRSIALERLAPLLALPFEFHVLQNAVRPTDQSTLEQFPQIRCYGAALTNFAETAALAGEMDLVISVDTSLAHLAGALGLPVWIMLPFSPDWRWLVDRPDSPWYPNARLYRQPALLDWDSVIATVCREVQARFPAS